MSWLITGTQKTDPDALAYLSEVERADGQALESGIRDAVIAFVAGCKTDGIWNAFKAICIMAGARTVTGALVPLVGVAPTNFNFVSGDYDRKNGISQSSTKKIVTNYNNNSAPQNNSHFSMRITGAGSIGMVALDGGNNFLGRGVSLTATLANRSTVSGVGANSIAPGALIGTSRSSAAGYDRITALGVSFVTATSAPPTDKNIEVLVSGGPGSNFYSIGESLDLALLDARVTALINAIAAAI
jgi:hypothetical protein